MKKNINRSCLWLLFLSPLSACSDMNELHQPFLDKGEYIYAAKIDKAVAHPGNCRLQLDLIYSAQRIKKCVIYWDVRQDSLLQDLPESGKEGVPIMINNLAEGDYSFEVVTQDKNGNRSLPVESNGKVYGANYQGSLINIKVESVKTVGGITTILWKNIEFASEIEFTYETNSGENKTIMIPVIYNTKTVLTDNKAKGSYSYVTTFKPVVTAIDVFRPNSTIEGTFP